MRYLALSILASVMLTACTRDSRSGEIAASPSGLLFEFTSNTDGSPRATGQAEISRNDQLRCTYQGINPETGETLNSTTTLSVPGLYQRLNAVLSVAPTAPDGRNSNSGLGQNRTAPYRTPTGQIIDVLNTATAPAPCMPET